MNRPYISFLKHDLRAFVAFKRALGYRYIRNESTLRRFDRYVKGLRLPRSGRSDMSALIEGWLTQYRAQKANTISNALQVVRQFCLFRRRYDHKGFVPGGEFPADRQPRFVPHVYSHADVRRLLRYLSHCRGSRLQHSSSRLLLLILYCTGLRAGEAARLCMQDLDLKRRLLWIRDSKGRTRLVPFGSDLAAVFAQNLCLRGASFVNHADPLLVSYHGRRYSRALISETVRRWLRASGLKPNSGRRGPRCHDFRHTFAVHRLSRWYRQGIDPNQRLAWLSVYMGHANILGTEIYLQTTPELLGLVGRRFEARFQKNRLTR